MRTAKQQKKQKNKNGALAATARQGTLPPAILAITDVVRPKLSAGRVYSFDLAITPLTFTIVTGNLAVRSQFTLTAVALVMKLAALFQEVRVRGVRLAPRLSYALEQGTALAGGGAGYTSFWIDETILTTAAPTGSDMTARSTCMVPNNQLVRPDAQREVQWVASDVEDLDWVSIKSGAYTSFYPFTLCAFAGVGYTPGATTGTGTTANTGGVLWVSGTARIEFRGLAQV